MDSERPILITAIGIITFIIGAISIATGAWECIRSDSFAVGIADVVLGVVALIVAYGFFQGWSWIWYLGLVMYVLIAMLFLITIIGIPVTIVCIVILFYMGRPNVKRFFGIRGSL